MSTSTLVKAPTRRVPPAPPRPVSGSTIRVVAARTGLAMDTLRAWERRYGFPRPERRPGSNRRLYADADVRRLDAIVRALSRGYRIGDVVDKSETELDALACGPDAALPAPASAAPADVDAMLEALARDDVPAVEAALRLAAAALGPKRFVTDVAHPLAVRVGEAWAEGTLAVRHEHAATECLTTQLRLMLAAHQDVVARPLVLLATLPGEPHALALQMVALYLAAFGAKPRLLGASTPVDQLVHAAHAQHADVVGLTVTPIADRVASRRAVKALAKAVGPRVRVWLGGGGAEALGLDDSIARTVTSWGALESALGETGRARRTPRA